MTASASDELARRDAEFIVHPHSTFGSPARPMVIARGSGATVWDSDGNEYLDGTCGLWQCPVGHGREDLADVARAQMATLEFYSSFGDLSNEPSIQLAEELIGRAAPIAAKVFFTNGGSEGVETSIKIARLAHYVNGNAEKNLILSRADAYHGVGSASLAATGIDAFHTGFGPMNPGFSYLSKPHARLYGDGATDFLVAELEERIANLGAHRIAAFIGEPVMGVGGMIPPPDGYWPRVREVLRKHDILLIADEIVTAFGRLGSWFGSQVYDMAPDLTVTAKGLSSGYVPMGAVLIGQQVLSMLDGANFMHGFTYNGHPVGCAVALENLRIIEREGLLERAVVLGERIGSALASLNELDGVIEVRQAGAAFGIELAVDDLDPTVENIREHGALARGAGPNIVLSPPLVMSDEEADRLADAVIAGVRQTFSR